MRWWHHPGWCGGCAAGLGHILGMASVRGAEARGDLPPSGTRPHDTGSFTVLLTSGRMHIHFLDPYHPLESPIHTLDVRVKFILTIGFVVACSLTPSAAWPACTSAWRSSCPSRSSRARNRIRGPALCSRPALCAGGVSGDLHDDRDCASPHSKLAAIAGSDTQGFGAVCEHCIEVVALGAGSDPVGRFLAVSRSAAGDARGAVPKLLVAMFGLMWRYLFVLMDEALRLIRARAARSGGWKRRPPGQAGPLWRASRPGAWQAICCCGPSRGVSASMRRCSHAVTTAKSVEYQSRR